MASVAERVAAGLALLDERSPAAVAKIDPARLDIEDCFDCALGQVYGTYAAGLAELHLDDPEAHNLGFTFWADRAGIDASDAEWKALTAEWQSVIAARRDAAKEDR